MLSALVQVRNSPFASLKPVFSAEGSFKFDWRITRTLLSSFAKDSAIAPELSVEPSSTIISSSFL